MCSHLNKSVNRIFHRAYQVLRDIKRVMRQFFLPLFIIYNFYILYFMRAINNFEIRLFIFYS